MPRSIHGLEECAVDASGRGGAGSRLPTAMKTANGNRHTSHGDLRDKSCMSTVNGRTARDISLMPRVIERCRCWQLANCFAASDVEGEGGRFVYPLEERDAK